MNKLTPAAKTAQQNYLKKWRAEHKEHIREYHRQWRANNKDKQAEYQRKYWERKAEQEKGVQDNAGNADR